MTRAQRARSRETITPRSEGQEFGTGDRFLIVVEGSETERRYLEALCGKLRFTASKVIIESPDTDPLNLLEEAIRHRDREARRAEQTLAVAFNQVWIVCDRETKNHPRKERLKAACLRAQAEGIHVALSIPSFEVWLLLHLGDFSSALDSSEEAEHALDDLQLKRGYPRYDKAQYPLSLYLERENLVQACKRADWLRSWHKSSDSCRPPRFWTRDFAASPAGNRDPDGNPCTDVDELVRQLNLAANPRFRLLPFPLCNRPAPFTRD